jgi:hypothetical protein
VSRNGPIQPSLCWLCSGLISLLGGTLLSNFNLGAQPADPTPTAGMARVVVVRDPQAVDAYKPRPERVAAMVHRGLTNLTGRPTVAAAWRSLVSTQDVVGIKVYSAPGPDGGTRPAVVAGLIEGLLQAGLPPTQIVVWDRFRAHLRQAGYFDLGQRYGVVVQGCDGAGFDEATFYLPDRRIIGQLVAGDLEFGRQGEGVGLKSFVTKLLTQRITKIINVAPLLNHNRAGVCGLLYSLSMGSIDNRIRFEIDAERLATAVPEVYALPAVGDRVVLNILDALICQYQGETEPRLHYATELNELWFSRDPLALDCLALSVLEQERLAAGAKTISKPYLELYRNAALLELGVNELDRIRIERLELAR